MNQCYIALLVIISTNGMVQLAKTEGFLDDHPDSYWLVVSVLSIEWRKGCLTTAGCVKPRFQLTKMNTANNEANLISWPIALKLAEVNILFIHFANISVIQYFQHGRSLTQNA